MSLVRNLYCKNVKNIAVRHNETQLLLISCRKLSLVPSLYDGDQDPAPNFFSKNVQTLLKRLTRPDFNKVFRKRTNSAFPVLMTPKYKFLTTEELEDEMKRANRKANMLLQMPPVVKVHTPMDDVLSSDPALIGYDNSTYLFTDITFGVDNQHRIIVQSLDWKPNQLNLLTFPNTNTELKAPFICFRDPDGTLRSCDHALRKKLNQVYFPLRGRMIREPNMFTDSERLNTLLDQEKYEFVLDRACLQYEPDEPSYQRVTSIAYQHVDAMKKYDILRSTRHFGPLTFYLTWHQNMDSLMLELLLTGVVREAVLLAALRHEIHKDVGNGDTVQTMVGKILPAPIQHTKQEQLTESDIELDNQCVDCIAKYIATTSSMKSQQELALQGFREHYQQLVELSRGLKKAHGKM